MVGQQASTIWIATWGSRGDHEPAVALALGLRERGHRVKVFGVATMRKMVESYGVDFDPLDMDVLTHPANSAAKKKLQQLASEAGFEGPNKEEDFYLETTLLWCEYFDRRYLKALAATRSFEKAGEESGKSVTDYLNFKAFGTGLETLSRTRHEHAELLAKVHGEALEDFTANFRRRCATFKASLSKAAADLRVHPNQLWYVIHGHIGMHLAMRRMDPTRGEAERVAEDLEKVADLHSWYDLAAEDQDGCLDEYWKRWMSCCMSLEAGSLASQREMSARATLNMKLWYDSASGAERPDIVVNSIFLLSAAVNLQVEYGVKFLCWLPQCEIRSLERLGGQCGMQCMFEGDFEDAPKPVAKQGYLKVLRMLLHAPLLIGLSALSFSGNSISTKNLRAHCTGKWVLDSQETASPTSGGNTFGSLEDKEALESFLASDGGAPVYMGWGSMDNMKGLAEHARLIVRSLRKIGRRGVVVAGWSKLSQSILKDAISEEYKGDPEGAEAAERRTLIIASASHEFLMPRCACTVHHGGMGTTQAALRAGVPTVVAPCGFDQPANADWVVSLGCGVKVAFLSALTADELAEAVTTVLSDDKYQTKAKEVAAVMVKERGVAAAADLVEKCLKEPPPRYTAPAAMPPPWVNGVYEFQKGSSLDLTDCKVVGEGLQKLDGTPFGQMWAGEFRVEENDDGVPADTYAVQALWSATVLYGRLSFDGKIITWHDGSRHTLKAAPKAPQPETPAPRQSFKWTQGPGGVWKKVHRLLNVDMVGYVGIAACAAIAIALGHLARH